MLRRKPSVSYLKGIIFWLLSFLFLIPSPAWGADCIPDDMANVNLVDVFTCMLGNLATFLITVSPFIAVALLAFGGIKYMASAGDEKSLQSAKRFLTWVILGFLAVFGAVFIFKLITAILQGEPGYIP